MRSALTGQVSLELIDWCLAGHSELLNGIHFQRPSLVCAGHLRWSNLLHLTAKCWTFNARNCLVGTVCQTWSGASALSGRFHLNTSGLLQDLDSTFKQLDEPILAIYPINKWASKISIPSQTSSQAILMDRFRGKLRSRLRRTVCVEKFLEAENSRECLPKSDWSF